MRSGGLLAVVIASMGCQCGQPPLRTLSAARLSVEPRELDFGEVFVGQTKTLSLSVENLGERSAALVVDAPSPFSAPTAFEVAGLQVEPVPVTFSPALPGHVERVVQLGTVQVPVRGVALAVPVCEARLCHTSRFEPETRGCVSSPSPAGTPCDLDCLEAGVCDGAGSCRGRARSCDDGDACTTDACGPDGCVHVPVRCESDDPCQVARCDARLGCVSEPADDGASCGRSSCEVANVCIAGRCANRQRPGWELGCRFEEVVALGLSTCARDRRGDVKCWGRTFERMELQPRLRGLRGLTVVGGSLCGVNGPGVVDCIATSGGGVSGPRRFGGPAQSVISGALPATEVCAVLTTGAVECALWDGGVVTLRTDGVAEAVVTTGSDAALSVRLRDGGVELPDGSRAVTTPARQIGLGPRLAPCVLTEAGILECSHRNSPDAGYVFEATDPIVAFGVAGSELHAVSAMGWVGWSLVPAGPLQGPSATIRASAERFFTPPIRSITRNPSAGHLCVIDGDFRLWCRGRNGAAQLGDFSAFPQGLLELPGTDLVRVVAHQGVTGTLDRSGRVTVFVTGLDGGYPLRPPGLFVDLGKRAVQGDETTTEFVALAADGGVSATRWVDGFSTWRPDTGTSRALPRLSALPVISGEAFGWSGTPLGPAIDSARGFLLRPDGGVEQVTERPDGGVSVYPLDTPWSLRALSPDSTAALGGCGLTRAGAVGCWRQSTVRFGYEFSLDVPGDAGVPVQIVGNGFSGCVSYGNQLVRCWDELQASVPRRESTYVLPAAVRDLSTGSSHVCALIQSGRALCWGQNQNGQLGSEPLVNSDAFIPPEL